MSDIQAAYREKLRSAREIVEGIKPGNTVVFGVWSGQAHGMMRALARYGSGIDPLIVAIGLTLDAGEFMMRPGIHCITGFLGRYDRVARANFDNVFYVPAQYTDSLDMTRAWQPPADYFIQRVAPMDERGYFNFSLTASGEYTCLRWLHQNSPSTKIVLEVNRRLPRVFGLEQFGANEVHLSEADFIIEDDSPLQEFPAPAPSETESRIAANVAALVEDRSTVQLGIGTLPSVMGELISQRRELGIHTEMFSDAHLKLVEAGAVTNTHKGLYNGRSIAAFAAGCARLADWARENREFAILPIEEVNSVAVLAKVRNLVSVNSVLTIDLVGQTCAHCLGPTTYSGLGGAFEFTYGARVSEGGRSIQCLPSTTTLKDGRVVSNIVARYPEGTRITVPEHCVDWVATEYGAARLKFLCLEQRAQALIDIAHPDFRDELARQAEKNGLRISRLSVYPPAPAAWFSRA